VRVAHLLLVPSPGPITPDPCLSPSPDPNDGNMVLVVLLQMVFSTWVGRILCVVLVAGVLFIVYNAGRPKPKPKPKPEPSEPR